MTPPQTLDPNPITIDQYFEGISYRARCNPPVAPAHCAGRWPERCRGTLDWLGSVQVGGARQDLLRLGGSRAQQCDAVVVTEIDQCIAMRVGSNERLQFLDGLHVGEVIEFDRIV